MNTSLWEVVLTELRNNKNNVLQNFIQWVSVELKEESQIKLKENTKWKTKMWMEDIKSIEGEKHLTEIKNGRRKCAMKFT